MCHDDKIDSWTMIKKKKSKKKLNKNSFKFGLLEINIQN